MSAVPSPYTQSERRALLDEYFQLLPAIEDPEKGGSEYDRALEQISELWDTYVERTPVVPISRCPFTHEVFQPSLDAFGFDGLFWKYDAAARRSEIMRGSVFAFTGAARVVEPVEPAPFLVRPGPEVPFVVPRMLNREEIRAVISSVPIGRHTGYAIVYYSAEPVMDLERFNTWGLDYYDLEVDEDVFGWNSAEPVLQDYDFDLAPWIEQGRLLWIAPGDGNLELREGIAGCPYLNLQGRRLPLCIQGGEVWTASLWDGRVPDDEPSDDATAQAAGDSPAPAAEQPGPPAPAPRYCEKCGAKLRESAAFCTKCGTRIGG
jgi:hypothetical protein